jgi:hypothetical protein
MIKRLTFALTLMISASPILAQTWPEQAERPKTEMLWYFGAGSSTGSYDGDKTPLSMGGLFLGDRFNIGLDFGYEGQMLDARGNNYKLTQGKSYNFLIGANLHKTEKTRLDAALLVGIRETAQDCPPSLIGYACYAGLDPDSTYKGNYGALVTYSFNKTAVGLRVTGESVQGVLGWRF